VGVGKAGETTECLVGDKIGAWVAGVVDLGDVDQVVDYGISSVIMRDRK
jgi:hypothetical protein